MKKKSPKNYMSLTTGEIAIGIGEVIKISIHDLRYHFINVKWMEEGKATRLLKEGRL